MATDATPGTSPLLRPTEAARRLSVSRSTIYRMVNRGELPALRIGGGLRFDARELNQYVYADEPDDAR
ncbi:MAG TPA: helix-turn-helix domain-containing protein [Solirubrobacteraceae bacterium]|nr:helix-turn-helix domain-containing protein [Solirubrobacteraceae bacterium]